MSLQEQLHRHIRNSELKTCIFLLSKITSNNFRCKRLGLTSLAYLWDRDQDDLLNEMIEKGMDVILIKTAVAGLEPEKHLGKTLVELKDYFQVIVKENLIDWC